jgi:hypothetical protein
VTLQWDDDDDNAENDFTIDNAEVSLSHLWLRIHLTKYTPTNYLKKKNNFISYFCLDESKITKVIYISRRGGNRCAHAFSLSCLFVFMSVCKFYQYTNVCSLVIINVCHLFWLWLKSINVIVREIVAMSSRHKISTHFYSIKYKSQKKCIQKFSLEMCQTNVSLFSHWYVHHFDWLLQHVICLIWWRRAKFFVHPLKTINSLKMFINSPVILNLSSFSGMLHQELKVLC